MTQNSLCVRCSWFIVRSLILDSCHSFCVNRNPNICHAETFATLKGRLSVASDRRLYTFLYPPAYVKRGLVAKLRALRTSMLYNITKSYCRIFKIPCVCFNTIHSSQATYRRIAYCVRLVATTRRYRYIYERMEAYWEKI